MNSARGEPRSVPERPWRAGCNFYTMEERGGIYVHSLCRKLSGQQKCQGITKTKAEENESTMTISKTAQGQRVN